MTSTSAFPLIWVKTDWREEKLEISDRSGDAATSFNLVDELSKLGQTDEALNYRVLR